MGFTLRNAGRRTAALLLLTTLFLSPAAALGAEGFVDVNSSQWYYGAVDYAARNGLVAGTSATAFSPHSPVTRGQLVTILGRLEGITAGDYPPSTQFSDVAPEAYWAPYITWALSAGIAQGTSSTAFSPNRSLTREQTAVMVSNYLSYKEVTLPSDPQARAQFIDASKISQSAAPAVETLRVCGLLTGNDKGALQPQKNVTRAEACALLQRLCQKLQAQGLSTGGQALPTWFGPSAAAFTFTTDTTGVGIYSLLRPEAQENLGDTGYTIALLSISDPTVLGVENDRFVPLKTGVVTVKWSCTTPTGEVFITQASVAVCAVPGLEAGPTKPYVVDENYLTIFNNEVIRLVNLERAKVGLSKVTYDGALQSGATLRAQELQKTFSHKRPNGEAFWTVYPTLAAQSSYHFYECNQYYPTNMDYSDPKVMAAYVVTAWMNSPNHKSILLAQVEGLRAACGITQGSGETVPTASLELFSDR